ncbi:MAG TPA: tRNA (adenosine(37)-N6)-threonylcarbamoyltransferase complex dimerization subunit type 1 TsaB [Puia sp.]|nr:tRNA (adenosine(37)-N6)-threonylcarbamoyltransferase complex dimerization subunit type 1 TsaB [Puia sp.]
MALILNIDTATQTAGICLADDGKVLAILENRAPKEHAAWLHPAVERSLSENGLGMRDLAAVAVTAGPGSYTGLRVGMAAAKGFCYALGIPLITESTLKVMAFAAREQLNGERLLCPMIDARRMEVFTAIYRPDMTELLPASAMIIDERSFSGWLQGHRIAFFGEGSDKCKPLINSCNASFERVAYHTGYLGILSFSRYLQKEFTGLAYSEPVYTKEFYTHTRK